MFCTNCGKEIVNESASCPFCGAPVADAVPEAAQSNSFENMNQPSQQPASEAWGDYTSVNAQPAVDRQSVTKKEFIAKYAPQNLKKNIKTAAIVCYICVAISAVAALVLLDNPLMLIDVVVYLALTLGMHLGNSKICAILLLIFSVVECIISIVSFGTPAGWWLIIAAASAVSTFRKLDKEYNNFRL